jgi:hypothetical protein
MCFRIFLQACVLDAGQTSSETPPAAKTRIGRNAVGAAFASVGNHYQRNFTHSSRRFTHFIVVEESQSVVLRFSSH